MISSSVICCYGDAAITFSLIRFMQSYCEFQTAKASTSATLENILIISLFKLIYPLLDWRKYCLLEVIEVFKSSEGQCAGVWIKFRILETF